MASLMKTAQAARRRTSAFQDAWLPTSQESMPVVSQVRGSLSHKRLLRAVVLLCMLAFIFWPSSKLAEEDPTLEETPYLVDKAYLGRSADWVGDKVRAYKGHLPKLRRPQLGGLQTVPTKVEVPEVVEEAYERPMEWRIYQSTLSTFARQSFPTKLGKWTVKMLQRWSMAPRSERIPRQIWQTAKEVPSSTSSYEQLNPQASYFFLDDGMVQAWLVQHFSSSAIQSSWDRINSLGRKADFWKYLVLYLEGGYYSDFNTVCSQPVVRWGVDGAVIWDVGGAAPIEVLQGPPQLIVGLDTDLLSLPQEEWGNGKRKPLLLASSTLASIPGHPVLLDVIQRIFTATGQIDALERQRKREAKEVFAKLTSQPLKARQKVLESGALRKELETLLLTDPLEDTSESSKKVASRLEGALSEDSLTEAVFTYLYSRYAIHWSQLRGIKTAVRIGEVAIMPLTAFKPTAAVLDTETASQAMVQPTV